MQKKLISKIRKKLTTISSKTVKKIGKKIRDLNLVHIWITVRRFSWGHGSCKISASILCSGSALLLVMVLFDSNLI